MIYGDKFLNKNYNSLDALSITLENEMISLDTFDIILNESFGDMMSKLKEKIADILAKISKLVGKIFPAIEKWLNGVITKLMHLAQDNNVIAFKGEKTIEICSNVNEKYKERVDAINKYKMWFKAFHAFFDKNVDDKVFVYDTSRRQISEIKEKLDNLKFDNLDDYFDFDTVTIKTPKDYKEISDRLAHLNDISKQRKRELTDYKQSLEKELKELKSVDTEESEGRKSLRMELIKHLSDYVKEIAFSIKIAIQFHDNIIGSLKKITKSGEWNDTEYNGAVINNFDDPDLRYNKWRNYI